MYWYLYAQPPHARAWCTGMQTSRKTWVRQLCPPCWPEALLPNCTNKWMPLKLWYRAARSLGGVLRLTFIQFHVLLKSTSPRSKAPYWWLPLALGFSYFVRVSILKPKLTKLHWHRKISSDGFWLPKPIWCFSYLSVDGCVRYWRAVPKCRGRRLGVRGLVSPTPTFPSPNFPTTPPATIP